MTNPGEAAADASESQGSAARTPQRPRTIEDLPSLWRPVNRLQERQRDGIDALYDQLGIQGVRPRFSSAIMFLQDEPLSIRDLAERCRVTHSAMSQSVAAMRKAGLVETEPGTDARSRVVSLTARGREVAPVLWREWYATENVAAEVAAEAGVSLSDAVDAMNAALDRESFIDRLVREMGR